MTAGGRASLSRDHFDLLPFIAILLCILGCLLLVTITMAVVNLGPSVKEVWVPSNANVNPGPSATAAWVPSNNGDFGCRVTLPDGRLMLPVIIEWDGATVVVHDNDTGNEQSWPHDSDEFRRFLSKLELNKGTQYALLAVRPSGFESYVDFSNEFRRRGISVGSEPVHQARSIDTPCTKQGWGKFKVP